MTDQDDTRKRAGTIFNQAHEVRYSYQAMMEEVEEERLHSVVGRELIDAVEINQIFARRRRKIKK